MAMFYLTKRKEKKIRKSKQDNLYRFVPIDSRVMDFFESKEKSRHVIGSPAKEADQTTDQTTGCSLMTDCVGDNACANYSARAAKGCVDGSECLERSSCAKNNAYSELLKDGACVKDNTFVKFSPYIKERTFFKDNAEIRKSKRAPPQAKSERITTTNNKTISLEKKLLFKTFDPFYDKYRRQITPPKPDKMRR